MGMLNDLVARPQANVESGLPDQTDQPLKVPCPPTPILSNNARRSIGSSSDRRSL